MKTKEWKISCDGWYPYCPSCSFEPHWNFVHEYGLPKYCPKCGEYLPRKEGDPYDNEE